jgi:hypothetical protein
MFYAGLGFGPTQLKLGNNERTVEGINFTFTADNNDAGGETHAGYWITDNIGIEVGARDYGTVKVPFVFSDPHDNTTGTGESEVRINGFIMSAVFGADITPTLQLFGHMGVFKWKERFDSRFDMPGQPAIHRSYANSGSGISYGAGVSWRFKDTWAMQARFEHDTIDEDEVTMFAVGFTYDIIGLLR